MDVTVLVDVEDNDSLVDGIVVGAEGDLPADTLYCICTRYLFQGLLQVVGCEADVGGEGDVGGLQHGKHWVIGEYGVGGGACVAVYAARVLGVRVVGGAGIREEFGVFRLQ